MYLFISFTRRVVKFFHDKQVQSSCFAQSRAQSKLPLLPPTPLKAPAPTSVFIRGDLMLWSSAVASDHS